MFSGLHSGTVLSLPLEVPFLLPPFKLLIVKGEDGETRKALASSHPRVGRSSFRCHLVLIQFRDLHAIIFIGVHSPLHSTERQKPHMHFNGSGHQHNGEDVLFFSALVSESCTDPLT